MENIVIAFIGAGNMGASLISGLIANGFSEDKLWVSDPVARVLNALSQQGNIHTTTDNKLAVNQADVVVLALKPQHLPAVAKELASTIQDKRVLVISIAAGIRDAQLRQWLGEQTPIVRCMPNMPALVRCGASGLYANGQVSSAQKGQAEFIMRAVGVVQWLDRETDLDTVTAVSGSGPAYFFLMMEALEQAAVKEGLSRETAHLLITQTALGTAHMAMQSTLGIAQLRAQVTSKGGTTEAALDVLTSAKFSELLASAIAAAKQRANELARIFHE